MTEKITYGNLSAWVKIAILTSWAILGYISLMFIWGFLEGFFGT